MSIELEKLNTNLKKYIAIIPNVLSTEFCKLAVEKKRKWYTAKVGNNVYDPDMRNCSVAHVDAEEDKIFYNAVAKVYEIYSNNFMNLTSSQNLGESVTDTGYEILRYKKNEFYKCHTDDSKSDPRRLALSFILNEDFCGGEFQFFSSHKVAPKIGEALVFPANFTYPHEVLEITQGTRHAMITWIY
jgi:predicted 2-oxoglutarate/Fe(II)-dependent dioxygenase YbiX|tara:strand:- start:307 stop:864 length:558 start_codon:yes stop_codon:yes gene_type:complete